MPDTTLTLENYLNGREVAFPLTPKQLENAQDLLQRLQSLELDYGSPLTITSGYRPPALNGQVLGAKAGDAHESCEGVDLRDRDKKLSGWCVAHIEKLVELGLWLESPNSAHDHVHLQSRPPKSGNRIFIA